MYEGLKYLEGKLREKYSNLRIGTKLVAGANTNTITKIHYDADRNTLMVTIDNGQSIGAKQLMEVINKGLISIK